MMKKLLLTAFCAAATMAASAQGTLNFLNGTSPITDVAGVGLGAGFTAQLQMPDGSPIGVAADFRQNGIFVGGVRTIDGVSGPGPVDLQVFVTNADGTITGNSGVFAQPLGGHGTPPATPANLAMPGFAVTMGVIPEPSHIALALLGGAALFLKRRKK